MAPLRMDAAERPDKDDVPCVTKRRMLYFVESPEHFVTKAFFQLHVVLENQAKRGARRGILRELPAATVA
eukprot:CAMPEP_0185746814 /NCGR_PEP_ID=MMETSP1174-20130828/5472_1 /TAXON_ID=35687 /ORGANISM="Dictyocha speculum, Strain CCMP1381" /LENGTH=69 /DNA_ID=CAMNT_0028421725 /DNA_START=652 /DNA_END=861 /DNA_ORIENTATION=-